MTETLPIGGAPAVSIDAAPTVKGLEPIFLADSASGADLLGVADAIQPLAELCAHGRTQGPLMIGLVGPSGTGKSFALEQLVGQIESLSAAARKAARGPFLPRLIVARVDATAAAQDPAAALAAAAHEALSRPGADAVDNAALADEAAHAGVDPRAAAVAASERHDEVRRRLDAERRQLDEIEARRARLMEAVLYDTPGSRVDAYARANRTRIEARLRSFDLAVGEPTSNFKDLVRDLASAGAGSNAAVIVRSVWAYGSQLRLLLITIVMLALALGANALRGPAFGDWLRGFGSGAAVIADWLNDHGGWIETAVEIFVVLAAIALFLNLWRAMMFTGTLFRGRRLLTVDMRERRRDLEAAAAHSNRRLAALTVDAEHAARHADAAEKRLSAKGAPQGPRSPAPAFLDAAQQRPAAARAFLAALGRLMSAPADAASSAPRRMIFVLDGLDALAPARTLDLLDGVHAVLGPASVALVALDLSQLADTAQRHRVQKLFQIVFNAHAAGAADGGRLMARLLGAASAGGVTSTEPDPLGSRLDEPLTGAESSLLTALAPLAGDTPRAVKRFLNAYRVARLSFVHRPSLALMLSVATSGDSAAQAGLEQVLSDIDGGALPDPSGPSALISGFRATRAASGGSIRVEDALAARAAARRFSVDA